MGTHQHGHVGESGEGHEGSHRGWRYGIRNPDVDRILEPAECIANAGFQKKTEHLITYKSGPQAKTQIGYLLIRTRDRKQQQLNSIGSK